MTLPQTKQTRQGRTPLDARVLLAGMPKSGKSTLAAGWAPNSTLIIDTQKGTTLLEGEHYVSHVANWYEFNQVVEDLVKPGHQFKTVVIDMIDDVWNFVDAACAGSGKALATATEDYNRSAKQAEGTFRNIIGKLLATELGVWFVTHTKATETDDGTRYVPRLDARVLTYVAGACEFILLAEALGAKRRLHTQPTTQFEAGSRVPLPDPLDLDARGLFDAMAKGLAPKDGERPAETLAPAEPEQPTLEQLASVMS